MKNFEQRKAEYLTKIKNNPDIISKFVVDKNSEEGKKTIERIFDPKDEKELFVAETAFSLTSNFLLLFDKIRNDEVEEVQNADNIALQLYIEIIKALKNNEKEYAKCLIENISPKDAARMMYETVISFSGGNSYDCIEYICDESGFDCWDENEVRTFYSYFEQAKDLISKNDRMAKELEDCTVEDFEHISEMVNELSRLCQKDNYCKTK